MSQTRQLRFIILLVAGCITLLLGGLHTGSIAASPPIHIASPTESAITQTVNLDRPFQELGIEGSIVIEDRNHNRYQHNPKRNATAFLPASTFKIFNALVSLETGVIPNDVAVLTWDGIQREFPSWNRDTNLRQGFKDSTIWFYQVLARKVGHQRMQDWINKVGYGNRQIGTPEQIDRFWLEGPLQITPQQQIEFLQRLDRGDLPFSQRSIDLVKDMMIVEQTPNYTLRGKTGWDNSVTPDLGWFVGYLEQNKNTYFFATHIVMPTREDFAKRIEVTRRSLEIVTSSQL